MSSPAPCIELLCATSRCKISLFGAHVLSYQHAGSEKLFVSKAAKLDGSRPIRGGIPVCWPWFGQMHPLIADHRQAHGLVRNQLWQIDAQKTTTDASSITLSPTQNNHALWPLGLSVQLVITLTSAQLSVTLISQNNSQSDYPLSAALHSYFAVDDIHTVCLTGITDLHRAQPSPYHIVQEVDVIHASKNAMDQQQHVTIQSDGKTLTEVTHQGHDSLVVWNPWQDKTLALVDMQDNEYVKMICIETALTQGFILAQGQQHQLTQIIS